MKPVPGVPERNWISFDCRGMELPETLLRVLERLDPLEKGDSLRMLHHVIPRLLFTKLKKSGFENWGHMNTPRFRSKS